MAQQNTDEANGVSEAVRDRHRETAAAVFRDDAYRLRIGGEWVDTDGGETTDVRDVTTGEVVAEYQLGTTADIDRAVDAAQATFENEWGELTASERASKLHELADRIDEDGRIETLTGIDSIEAGIPRSILEGVVSSQVAEPLRFFAGLAGSADEGAQRPADEEMLVYTRSEPYGVVGIIPAWNTALTYLGLKVAPALAAGNTVVLKPSPRASIAYLELAELFDEVLPDGTVNIVTGDVEAGSAISNHDWIRKVSLTGSVDAGRAVLRGAANSNLKSTTLELGGKSPHIVFPDADLETAAMGATMGIFSISGQVCFAGSRLFVHEDIYEEFMDQLRANTDLFWNAGDPLDSDTTYGPLINEEAAENAAQYVETAREEGAEVFMGGERPDLPDLGDAPFFEPTILTGVDNDDTVACEEVFGPVLSVMQWSDRDEMIRQANDTEYGLAAGLWTQNVETVHNVAAELEAGQVWVNCYSQLIDSAPFGGYKQSGNGRENGVEALADMRQTKTVTVNLGDFPRL